MNINIIIWALNLREWIKSYAQGRINLSAPLPPINTPLSKCVCLFSGGPQPAVLQKVNVPVWTNQECKMKYGAAAPGGIVEHFLCAGKAARDSCSVSINCINPLLIVVYHLDKIVR